MSVVLEDVNPQEAAEPAESVSVQNTEMSPEPESIPSNLFDTPPEQATNGVEELPPPPAPKKRGRPRKDPALPKAAPKPRAKRAAAPPPPPESSDEEPFSQND